MTRKSLAILAMILFMAFSPIVTCFADPDATPLPQPNDSSRSVFYSISDLFKNAGMAVSKELSKLSDSIRSQADLLNYKKMSSRYARYRETVEASAKHFSIPEAFLACLINKESSYEPLVVSPMGAKGIMQFMDSEVIAFDQQIKYDDYSKAAWATYPFKNGKVPARISLASVINPDLMIPAGALRFKARGLSLFGEFGADRWTVSQLMILVADYSVGPEGLARRCNYALPKTSRDPAPLDNEDLIDACINRLNPDLNKKATLETWDEMTKISECMIGLPKAF
jgi:hypothetical protein